MEAVGRRCRHRIAHHHHLLQRHFQHQQIKRPCVILPPTLCLLFFFFSFFFLFSCLSLPYSEKREEESHESKGESVTTRFPVPSHRRTVKARPLLVPLLSQLLLRPFMCALAYASATFIISFGHSPAGHVSALVLTGD